VPGREPAAWRGSRRGHRADSVSARPRPAMLTRRRAGCPSRDRLSCCRRLGPPVRGRPAAGSGDRAPDGRCARRRRCRNRRGAGPRRRAAGHPVRPRHPGRRRPGRIRRGARRHLPASRDRRRAVPGVRSRPVSGRVEAPGQVVSSLLQRLAHRFLSLLQSTAAGLAALLRSRHFGRAADQWPANSNEVIPHRGLMPNAPYCVPCAN
jgi:hypothetical protein